MNAESDFPPKSEIILYQTEDGRTRIQCRMENETLWLTQAQIAELFDKDVRTVNEHLVNIFDEGEISREATIRKFRLVRVEGNRNVAREIEYYSLPAILAVGYRVRSHRGTQFRQWATARLSEYLVKGFVMDDERLKNPQGKGQKDYFDELLERIRDIRLSERRFYQKILDIYATSVDYTPNAEVSQEFFATIQNSLKPNYAEFVFRGLKKAKLRRCIAKNMQNRDVFIYVSSPVRALRGGFRVGQIWPGSPDEIWEEVSRKAKVSKETFDEYYNGAPIAFAMEIMDVWEYKNPKTIDELRQKLPTFIVPQSYRFVKDEEIAFFQRLKRVLKETLPSE